mmetsp:Transcript_20638/g.50323  ORF Transcript_20638/g.50323 Transcript_20638/m.50323 type:complete len:99 (+) Transcript_20638:356-652(+)
MLLSHAMRVCSTRSLIELIKQNFIKHACHTPTSIRSHTDMTAAERTRQPAVPYSTKSQTFSLTPTRQLSEVFVDTLCGGRDNRQLNEHHESHRNGGAR